MSRVPSAFTSRVRAWYPPKQPATPPIAPSAPPRCACGGAAPAPTQAPVSAPVTIRAIRPMGAVRFGVFGSLSTTSSTIASTVRSATAGVDPITERGRSITSQPRWTAHAVTAGAVSERSPANNPIRNGNTRLLSTSRINGRLSAIIRSVTRRFTPPPAMPRFDRVRREGANGESRVSEKSGWQGAAEARSAAVAREIERSVFPRS